MPPHPDPQRPVDNRLLAALPPEAWARVRPQLEPVTFALGDLVYDANGPLDSLYFPTTAVVSLLYTMADGSTAEMGLTGNDGVVGIALVLGGDTTKPRSQELTLEQHLVNQALHQRRLRIEHVNSRVKRCRIVKDRIRLWKEGVRDLVMEICCALHNFRVRLSPWQPMV